MALPDPDNTFNPDAFSPSGPAPSAPTPPPPPPSAASPASAPTPPPPPPSAPSAPSPEDADLWEAFDAIRDTFRPRGPRGPHGPHGGPHGRHPHGPHGRGRGGPRAGRGDVRSAILLLLSEGEMHGYQIIREIEERSSGTWKPSPGSVYPTLQMLADEGLVIASETGGRKTYSLTKEGSTAAAKAKENAAPWQTPSAEAMSKAAGLPRAGAELAQAVSQLVTSGTPKQREAAIKILKDARRQIYGILAEE